MGFFSNPGKAIRGFFGISGGKGRGIGIGDNSQYKQLLALQQAKEAEVRNRRLTNDEIVKNLSNRLDQDQFNINRLSNITYPGKNNNTISPMTERAIGLRSEIANKRIPYSNKITQVLNKKGQGFSPTQSEALLDLLRRGGASEEMATKRLEKQFGQNYGYESDRRSKLESRVQKDIDKSINMSRENLRSLNEQLGTLEDARNIDIAKAFANTGNSKINKRNAYLDQIERFGNQQHSLNNLIEQSKRDAFEEERLFPQRKIANVRRALERLERSTGHPDREVMRNQELQRLQNIYNTPFQAYPGQRVVGIQPETQSSFDFINNFSPKYRDSYYGERKGIEKDLINNTLIDKTYTKIPTAMEPLMRNLDLLSKQQLKKASKDIAGKHVRLGTYGSGAHKAETEKELRGILKKVQQEREGILTGVSKAEMELGGTKDRTNLAKLGLLDTLGNREFVDLLEQNQQLNKRGWEKRANLQADENEALKNWYIQQQSNIGDVDSYDNIGKQYGMDLPSFYNALQTYSEKNSTKKRPAIMSNSSQSGIYNPISPNNRAFAYALARRTPLVN